MSDQALFSHPRGAYALVTGASQGLGRAFAKELAREGRDLILVALPDSGLPQAAREIRRAHGVRVHPIEVDLTASRGPEEVWTEIADRGLPVSTLVNNAGVGYNAYFVDSTLGENEACILLNNLATVKLTRLALPELQRHPEAHVLNVASMAAYFAMPAMPVYAPSKAFVLNFSLALRQELDGTSVGVSVLCPNGIRTNAECRRKIEASGWAARLTCMDPGPVAACALRGMRAGKGVIVPGALNRIIVALSSVAPQGLKYAVISRFWGRSARGARAPVARQRAGAASPQKSTA